MKEFFRDIFQYKYKDWILFHIDTADQHVDSVNVLLQRILNAVTGPL